VGRALVPSIRSPVYCFRAKQLQRKCIQVAMRPLLRHSSLSSLCAIPRLGEKNAARRAPTLGDVGKKERGDDDAAPTTLNNSSPCVASEFRNALEALFETLNECGEPSEQCLHGHSWKSAENGSPVIFHSICTHTTDPPPKKWGN
jgi:hypothetical protein